MTTTKQKEFRLRLPERVAKSMSTRAQQWEEQRINGKFVQGRHDLCRRVKEGIRGICHEITTCAPACVSGNLHPARVLCELGEVIMKEGLCDPTETARSSRNLANPLTLADYLAACELTIQQCRMPAAWLPKDQVSDLSDKVDVLAGMLARVCSTMGIEDGSEVAR